MTDEQKAVYDILWYLNEYPNEANATDQVIKGSLKITSSYQKAKNNLLNDGLIIQREDNKNNVAWKLTTKGQERFNKLKQDFSNENPLASEIDGELKQVQIAYYKKQIKPDWKFYIGLVVGLITTIAGAMITERIKKTPKEQPHIIEIHVSTHNAAIDTVTVKMDTMKGR